MTLNAVFSAGGIPCLISDHLVSGGSKYLTRKSVLISGDLVVAASGDEVSACDVLHQLHNRFWDSPVSRKSLFSFFSGIQQYRKKPYTCTIIGWMAQGRKKPLSFMWNSEHPSNPEVNRGDVVVGSGGIVYKSVTPPFVAMPEREPVANALSLCAERAGTLWVNDVLGGTLWETGCGGGFEVYVRDPRVNGFRYADEIGCLYIPLRYKVRRNQLKYDVLGRVAYMKTSVGSIRLMSGFLPCVRVKTIAIEPPRSLGIAETQMSNDTGLAAKMYACCFCVQDARNGTIVVDVFTAFGGDAEQFNFDVAPGHSPDSGLLLSPVAPVVIQNMAKAATKRFQDAGVNLV